MEGLPAVTACPIDCDQRSSAPRRWQGARLRPADQSTPADHSPERTEGPIGTSDADNIMIERVRNVLKARFDFGPVDCRFGLLLSTTRRNACSFRCSHRAGLIAIKNQFTQNPAAHPKRRGDRL